MKSNTLFITKFALLLAIEAFFCFTPLGSLPAIGPIVATLAMIPVMICSISLGTKAGSIMGAITGLFSFLIWTFIPPVPASAFIFTPFYSFGDFHGNLGSLIICFVPRILVGTFTGITYKFLGGAIKNRDYLKMIISSMIGSLTNTFGVLAGIAIFFGSEYAALAQKPLLLILGATILTNGIPEAIVSAIFVPAVCRTLNAINRK